MPNIGIILASIRPLRAGPTINKWLMSSINVKHNLDFEILDLAEWDLPLSKEPEMPQKAIYKFEKTIAWSEKIKSKDGFIFVTPEYNYGCPAPLKNAIDYLFVEWVDKPAVIVSYGFQGGRSSAGQIQQVLKCIKVKNTETNPSINLKREMFGQDGKILEEFAPFKELYSETINKAISELDDALKK